MKIILTGRIISKKNSRNIFFKNNKQVNIPSPAYKRFQLDAGYQLLKYKKPMLSTNLRIDYVFYFKGNMGADGDNLQASVNDILQNFGIIQDDRLIKEWTGKIVAGCPDWKTEIVIEEIGKERRWLL